MRNAAVIALSALLGGLIGGLIIFLVIQDAIQPGRRADGDPRSGPGGSTASSRRAAPKDPTLQQAALDNERAALVASANRLVAAGRLQEAQEAYLTVLLMDPSHQVAMKGLVRVVGLINRGNVAALRRQAQEYRRAIAEGLETEEHYTAPAMEILARASLEAAGDVRPARPAPAARQPRTGAADRPQPQARAPQATRPPAPPAPRERTEVRTPRRPSPPPTSPPATPPPAVPLDVNEPFFVVAVGPIPSGDRASAITAELTVAGFAARARRQEAGDYLITIGPYRQSEAQRAAAFVRSRFGGAMPVVLTPAK